jgi:hypothetical protein
MIAAQFLGNAISMADDLSGGHPDAEGWPRNAKEPLITATTK